MGQRPSRALAVSFSSAPLEWIAHGPNTAPILRRLWVGYPSRHHRSQQSMGLHATLHNPQTLVAPVQQALRECGFRQWQSPPLAFNRVLHHRFTGRPIAPRVDVYIGWRATIPARDCGTSTATRSTPSTRTQHGLRAWRPKVWAETPGQRCV